MEFPVIDLAGPPDDVASEFDTAWRDIGFLAVTGHGVARGTIAAAWDAAAAFFDLPEEEKLKSVAPPYGYSPFAAEALAAAHGGEAPSDLKESFNLGPFRQGIGAVWPARPAGFQQAWTAYYGAMEELAQRMLVLCAAALGVPAAAFLGAHDRHTSALRALNYPALDRPAAAGQIRAGAHSDYGSLTILLPGPGKGGLEVRTRSGEWLTVPLIDGAFVVNIGDIMERWTNDRWVSTVHRVVNPPHDVAGTERRQSIAFFHNPNSDARIETLASCVVDGRRYEPVVFAHWLEDKVAASHHRE